MPKSLARSGDRRELNVPVKADRRGGGQDRRKCPQCGSALKKELRTTSTGTVLTARCPRCDWKRVSRQYDLKVVLSKMTWELPIESRPSGTLVHLPAELMQALEVGAGDSLVLRPLTLPVGSLPMTWALELKKGK